MIPYGQMEDLLKATQLELARLMQVCEEQRIHLGAELMHANQRLAALQPKEMVSECDESGTFGNSKADESEDGWDAPSRDSSSTGYPPGGIILGSVPTAQPVSTHVEMVDDRPSTEDDGFPPDPCAANPAVQTSKIRPSTHSERDHKRTSRRSSEDRGKEATKEPKVARSPSNASQISQADPWHRKVSDGGVSDYSCYSDGSNASDASCVSEADPDDDGKPKRRKRTRKSGQKKKNETIGILLNEEQPHRASMTITDRVAKKVSRYIDHVAGALVLLNSLSMMVQLEMEGRTIAMNLGLPQGHNYSAALPFFRIVDEVFVWVFLSELLLRMFVEGRHFLKDIANWLDSFLVAGGLFDVIIAWIGGGNSGVALKFVSAMKAFRAIRMVRSFRFSPGLRMLVKACQCCLPSLCWSMLLLAVFMCMGALIMGNLLQDFIKDENNSMEDREWVWQRYGTTYRAMYTLYEITFAGNWPTNARPVLDKVSQFFVIFYLLYVTIIVFAVIRVISAIFLKDTLDEANNDAQQLILERMRKKAEYIERLETTFHSISDNGSEDGILTESRLTEILANPKVRAFFGTLEIDVQEGAALFHLLDNGDGEVGLEEFISGVMRCKGPAKAIDTFALQRDLGKLDHKVVALSQKLDEKLSFQGTTSLMPLGSLGLSGPFSPSQQAAPGPQYSSVDPLIKKSERVDRKVKTTAMSRITTSGSTSPMMPQTSGERHRKVSV